MINCGCDLQSLEAKTTYVAHQGVVEDVAWHQHHTDIFGSVGDDKQLILWDTRKPPRDGEHRTTVHRACIKAVLGQHAACVCVVWACSGRGEGQCQQEAKVLVEVGQAGRSPATFSTSS